MKNSIQAMLICIISAIILYLLLLYQFKLEENLAQLITFLYYIIRIEIKEVQYDIQDIKKK